MTMRVKEIASRNNPAFKKFSRLLKGRGVRKYGQALLSGPKQVREVLREFPDQCAGILVPKEQDVPETFAPERAVVYKLGKALFREMDLYGTGQPILLVHVEPLPRWKDEKWPKGCTLFIPFQDPSNVGAVIRSAVAFGVSRLVVLEEAADPFHHKSIRVAGSTIFRVPLAQGPSIHQLGQTAAPLLTLSPKGKDVDGYRFPRTFGLLPGLEGPGLPENLIQETSIAIPMEPRVESLNAALATGIILYLWRRGLRRTSSIRP